MLTKSYPDVIIIITEQSSELMDKYLSNYKGPLSIQVHKIAEELGTAEAVVQIKHLLTVTNFLFIFIQKLVLIFKFKNREILLLFQVI